jgi:hypothetical protein
VLQLVNTPDIYEENKYQRRNLLLYHCLLESGLRKFNVSGQLSRFQQFVKSRNLYRPDSTYTGLTFAKIRHKIKKRYHEISCCDTF